MKTILKWTGALFALLVLVVAGMAFEVLGGPVIVQEYLRHEQPDNLSFSFSRCEGHGPRSGPDSVQSWSGDTLRVDVNITPNCGTTWLFGSYRLQGEDELVLGYKSIVPGFVACDCNFKAAYEIAGIEKKDYRVTVREYALINRVPLLVRALIEGSEDLVWVEEL